MYNAQVLEVFIASPSDVCEERDASEQILHEWNTINSKTTGIVLQPRRWETSVYSEVGKHPQNIVNKQILESADLLIAIFGIRLGSQTLEYASGTVEEIEKHTAHNKPAMLFFSSTPVKSDPIDKVQWDKRQKFKAQYANKSYFVEYNDLPDFTNKLRHHISLFVNKLQENLKVNVNDNNSNHIVQDSQTKQDAIDFLYALRDKADSVSLDDAADRFSESITPFRLNQLRPFLKHLNLIEDKEAASGRPRIFTTQELDSLQKEDIDTLLQEVENGRYDDYLTK